VSAYLTWDDLDARDNLSACSIVPQQIYALIFYDDANASPVALMSILVLATWYIRSRIWRFAPH
jgi:hypothetical protein